MTTPAAQGIAAAKADDQMSDRHREFINELVAEYAKGNLIIATIDAETGNATVTGPEGRRYTNNIGIAFAGKQILASIK